MKDRFGESLSIGDIIIVPKLLRAGHDEELVRAQIELILNSEYARIRYLDDSITADRPPFRFAKVNNHER